MNILYSDAGGRIVLPDLLLVDRRDGGHLVVDPPRPVWERSELTADELALWSQLVASAGRAMLDVLPQLQDGCINYWEAGNWSLHDDAEPVGRKTARAHRKVHLHLLGRSPGASSPGLAWGEAPLFPRYEKRLDETALFEPLTAEECRNILDRTSAILRERYGRA